MTITETASRVLETHQAHMIRPRKGGGYDAKPWGGMFSPTFHRDHTVTFWSVYEQRWVRCKASRISDAELASMSDSERRRVARIVAKEVL